MSGAARRDEKTGFAETTDEPQTVVPYSRPDTPQDEKTSFWTEAFARKSIGREEEASDWREIYSIWKNESNFICS